MQIFSIQVFLIIINTISKFETLSLTNSLHDFEDDFEDADSNNFVYLSADILNLDNLSQPKTIFKISCTELT